MANNLNNVLPTIYEAADIVARELVGFINHCFRNSAAARAAKGQTITYPVVPSIPASDIVPGATSPQSPDQTQGFGSMQITKSRKAPFYWTGEEQMALGTGDQPQGQNILRDQFTQAMRTLCNEIEADLWAAAYQGASRAVGSAGATPFGTANDLSDFAAVQRALDDNGAPLLDRHLVVGGAAMQNLRGKQSVLFKVNEAGTEELLRRGTIGEVMGLAIGNSAPIALFTKGAGTGYVTSGSTGVGVNTIALVTGSGTVLAGDVVTFAADTTNKYVVNVGVGAPGTITIGAPGARIVIPTGNAMTTGANYVPNVGFHRNALHLITRAPAMPVGGDEADDVTEVTDPTSGLTFQVALYRQYRQVSYEVGMAWGVKAVKADFIAILMG